VVRLVDEAGADEEGAGHAEGAQHLRGLKLIAVAVVDSDREPSLQGVRRRARR